MAKAASLAYRVFDVGIEHNVKSFRTEWREAPQRDGKKAQKFLHLETDAADVSLVYADIVLISDAKVPAYNKTLAWQEKSSTLSMEEAKKIRPEGTAYCSVIRVYWYHNGTVGQKNGNVGFADLIRSTTMSDGLKSAIISEGNKGLTEALKIVMRIKGIHQAKGATGSHYACRPFSDFIKQLGRTVIKGLSESTGGRTYNWDKGSPGNRCRSHEWVEKIHGQVMDKIWEIHLKRKSKDSSLDSTAEAFSDIFSNPVAGESSSEMVAKAITSPGKIVEFEYKNQFGSVRNGYRLPDGTEILNEDIKRWYKVREEYWKQEGMLDNNKGEQNG